MKTLSVLFLSLMVDLLKEAIRRDPNFVPAYCLLAKVYSGDYMKKTWAGLDRRPTIELWKQVLDAAMRLRPDLAETHLAWVRYYMFLGDDDRARAELAIARLTLPNDSEATFLAARLERHQNRCDDALANASKANEFDPHNGEIIMWLCETYRLPATFLQCHALSSLKRNAGIPPTDPRRSAFAVVDPGDDRCQIFFPLTVTCYKSSVARERKSRLAAGSSPVSQRSGTER
jgi:tetratricopeptide (TPR) repeat protein